MRTATFSLLLTLTMCQSLAADRHTSENSLDWAGVYQGVVPCADCAGIETTLKLTTGRTYELSMTYLGKSATPISSAGPFEWRQDGRAIMLKTGDGTPRFYRVEENRLRQLDMHGEPITSALADKYVLQKLAANTASGQSTLTGTATYRERMTLPAQSVFEATLEDVSRVDAPAQVIGRARIENPGNPPIKFAIAYDPGRIDSKHRYVVRARIRVVDNLLFTTEAGYPVLTAGHPSQASLLLSRATVGVPSPTGSTPTLENTYWRLMRLGTRSVAVDENQREPHLILHPADKRVTGSGGCNSLAGTYRLERNGLTFSQMAGTMMACPSGMEHERAFHEVLGRVATWRIEGEQLELCDSSGKVIASFQSRHMK
jgi:putative lipoprotein